MSKTGSTTERLAAAVADGEAIDWSLVEAPEIESQRQLEVLWKLAAHARADGSGSAESVYHWASPIKLPAWLVAVIVIAGLDLVVAVTAWVATPADSSPVPGLPLIFAMGTLGITALVLISGGRRDRRAIYLGAFFMCAGATLAPRFIAHLRPFRYGLAWLAAIYVETFMPLLLWQFVRDFPRLGQFTRYDLLARTAIRVSAVCGLILCIANFASAALPSTRPMAEAMLRGGRGFLYWGVIFGLMLPALPIILLRARQASPLERDRVRVFAIAFAVCSAPFVLEVLLEIAFPSFYLWMNRPLNREVGATFLFAILMLVPIVSAYSVLVDRVFDVRVAMGRALQYALARHVLTLVAAIPLLILISQAIVHRDQPLRDLVGSLSGLTSVLLALSGLFLIRTRGWLQAHLDRLFFRRQSDHREVLASFSLQVLKAREIRDVAETLVTHTARAFGLEDAVVLARDAELQVFLPVGGACRPLPVASAIGALVVGSTSPVNVDPGDARSLFRFLPNMDQQWVLDSSGSLVVPIGTPDRKSFGLLLIGRKLSETAFSRDEQLSITSFAAASALALENISAQGFAAAPAARELDVRDEVAAECQQCKVVQPWKTQACANCGGGLKTAALPVVLLGKFKVEALLGRGGMGVVYRATDLILGRQVAVKTLPRLSNDSARRLRREARAMALVTHSNLALIYGAESWRATPILIVEFLGGGTLADRIAKESLPIREALQLGIDLASALERTHEAGVLHRDIKPSNIGFSLSGVPKLLDFGLARLLYDSSESIRPRVVKEPQYGLSEQTTMGQFAISNSRFGEVHKVAGTPLYLSPEAIAGAEPNASFDLWSLGVVLLEAMTGRNPFRAASLSGVFERIQRFKVEEELASTSLPEPVCRLFGAILGGRLSKRPSSAQALVADIQECDRLIP